jgi:hypothetical protein
VLEEPPLLELLAVESVPLPLLELAVVPLLDEAVPPEELELEALELEALDVEALELDALVVEELELEALDTLAATELEPLFPELMPVEAPLLAKVLVREELVDVAGEPEPLLEVECVDPVLEATVLEALAVVAAAALEELPVGLLPLHPAAAKSAATAQKDWVRTAVMWSSLEGRSSHHLRIGDAIQDNRSGHPASCQRGIALRPTRGWTRKSRSHAKPAGPAHPGVSIFNPPAHPAGPPPRRRSAPLSSRRSPRAISIQDAGSQ